MRIFPIKFKTLLSSYMVGGLANQDVCTDIKIDESIIICIDF